MKNRLKEILEQRKNNKNVGIPSYCTANDIVIKALLKRAAESNTPVLIEATANQVNQFGGYTGMKPKDFAEFVYRLAKEMGCDKSLVILGGDHLGPLTWKNLPEIDAMEHSKVLVYEYVKAGFTKIHLDTSMKLADDGEGMLPTKVIAERGAILYKECEKAFSELDGDRQHPVYVIGSEVPIPGGATEAEEGIEVTKVADFYDTVTTYKEVFKANSIEDAFDNIIGVVVQPGVEFSDSQVFLYDSNEAAELTKSIDKFEGLVFEGHSTDYQTKECLRQMVEDNIAILKVGPAMTYRFREALFVLSYIEGELILPEHRANFPSVLENAMLQNPGNWDKHYHGSKSELYLARRYSYSDRARYYLTDPSVKDAIDKLISNLKRVEIPLNLLHQFMPISYQKVIRGKLQNNVTELLYDAVLEMADDYEYACK